MSVPGEGEGQERHIDRSISVGSVEFENVTFSYPGSEAPALKDFSLKIVPGERVGIIGRIGSGKTTLGRLISRLYVPDEGSLLLDGVDVRQYHPSDIRRRVAFISQDSALFHGSVRDNIILGAPYVSDDLVIRAADLAGVSDFVKLHPQGFNMPVGEMGRFLSSGQRQTITLARAFLFDPMIVFLDEPSGSMDMASERALMQRLHGAFRTDQTLIITTHRTSMLALVTRLVVLENGSVIADGPRDSVLKMLREKAGVREADAGETHQVQNIVIPQQAPGSPIRVAGSGAPAGNSGSTKVPGGTSAPAAKSAQNTPVQKGIGNGSSKAKQAPTTPKSKKPEAAK
jgi:ATP-binding cassette subfamily C protein LapB